MKKIAIIAIVTAAVVFSCKYSDGNSAGVVSNDDTTTYKPTEVKIDSNTNGLVREYYDNGSLKNEDHYEKGVLNGWSVSYHQNGKKRFEGEYRNGNFYGKVVFYYSNGNKNSEEYYGVDSPTSVKIWYRTGTLKQEGKKNANGKMDGKWLIYHPDGKIASVNFYRTNTVSGFAVKDSVWLYFSETGDTLKKEVYRNDTLVQTIEGGH